MDPETDPSALLFLLAVLFINVFVVALDLPDK